MTDEEKVAKLESTIRSLNTTIDGLKEELGGAKEEAKTYRQGKAELKKQLDAAAEQVTTLTTERDGFKAKFENGPNEHKEEVERLRGEIRTRDHKDVFKRLAKDAKVRDEAIDDAWELSKYKPEGDAADEAKIKGLIGEVTKSRSYLLQPAEGEATPKGAQEGAKTTLQVPPSQRGPGSGKGVEGNPTAGSVADIVNTRWAKSGSAHDSGRL